MIKQDIIDLKWLEEDLDKLRYSDILIEIIKENDPIAILFLDFEDGNTWGINIDVLFLDGDIGSYNYGEYCDFFESPELNKEMNRDKIKQEIKRSATYFSFGEYVKWAKKNRSKSRKKRAITNVFKKRAAKLNNKKTNTPSDSHKLKSVPDELEHICGTCGNKYDFFYEAVTCMFSHQKKDK